MLLEGVWDYHFDPQTNVIDVHISRLRSKIDKGFSCQIIKTVRNAGYIIEDWRAPLLEKLQFQNGAFFYAYAGALRRRLGVF